MYSAICTLIISPFVGMIDSKAGQTDRGPANMLLRTVADKNCVGLSSLYTLEKKTNKHI